MNGRSDPMEKLKYELEKVLASSKEKMVSAMTRSEMKRLERQRKQEIDESQNKVEEEMKTGEVEIKEEEYKETRNQMRCENEEIEKRMLKRNEELREMNRVEKSNRVVIDKIFDIVRNWTDIEFLFCHLVGIKQALDNVCKDSDAVKKVRMDMVKKGKLILRLHETLKEQVDEVMPSLGNILEFVELGRCSEKRMTMELALRGMKNVEFWTLEHETIMDEAIEKLKSKVDEVRGNVWKLPLEELRPRISVRQRIQEHIEELFAETRIIRSGSFIRENGTLENNKSQ